MGQSSLTVNLNKLSGSQDAIQKLEEFEDEIDYTITLNEFSHQFQSLRRQTPPGYTKMRDILEKEYSEFTLKECKELDEHLASAFGTTTLCPPFYDESNSI